jgi:hypothetical protein
MDPVQFPWPSTLLWLPYDVSNHASEMVHSAHSAVGAAKIVRNPDGWVISSQAY